MEIVCSAQSATVNASAIGISGCNNDTTISRCTRAAYDATHDNMNCGPNLTTLANEAPVILFENLLNAILTVDNTSQLSSMLAQSNQTIH